MLRRFFAFRCRFGSIYNIRLGITHWHTVYVVRARHPLFQMLRSPSFFFLHNYLHFITIRRQCPTSLNQHVHVYIAHYVVSTKLPSAIPFSRHFQLRSPVCALCYAAAVMMFSLMFYV